MTGTGAKRPGGAAARTGVLYAAASALLIALGVYILIKPDVGDKVICGVVGALALIFGVIKLTVYFMTEVRGVGVGNDLTIGALCVIVGAILLLRPAGVVRVLQVLVGVYLIIDATLKLQSAVDAKRLGLSAWYVPLVLTAVCLGLGIAMILVQDMIMLLIGASLIADGLQNVVILVFIRLGKRKLAKQAEAQAVEASVVVEVPAENTKAGGEENDTQE